MWFSFSKLTIIVPLNEVQTQLIQFTSPKIGPILDIFCLVERIAYCTVRTASAVNVN